MSRLRLDVYHFLMFLYHDQTLELVLHILLVNKFEVKDDQSVLLHVSPHSVFLCNKSISSERLENP